MRDVPLRQCDRIGDLIGSVFDFHARMLGRRGDGGCSRKAPPSPSPF
jgi:hypothetical protein